MVLKTPISIKIIVGLHFKTMLNTSIAKINHIPVKFNVYYKVKYVNCCISEDNYPTTALQNCGCILKDGHVTGGCLISK